MQNETVEYYKNVFKSTLMENWAVSRSVELPVVLEHCRQQLADNTSSDETAEQLMYLEKAYHLILEELAGSFD